MSSGRALGRLRCEFVRLVLDGHSHRIIVLIGSYILRSFAAVVEVPDENCNDDPNNEDHRNYYRRG